MHVLHRAVLVGDPQQLPATVLSKAARAGLLERSLFERLQRLGHPCTLLSVQYRMHPAIRSFPSAFFYQNRLQDSCGPDLYAACLSAEGNPAPCATCSTGCTLLDLVCVFAGLACLTGESGPLHHSLQLHCSTRAGCSQQATDSVAP